MHIFPRKRRPGIFHSILPIHAFLTDPAAHVRSWEKTRNNNKKIKHNKNNYNKNSNALLK